MCGFICTIHKDQKKKKIDHNLLDHRGPDYTKEIDLHWVTVRHWRLSIQDLTKDSNQPINDDKHCLLYNGEFYDYKSLSNDFYGNQFASDTLLFFHALKKGDFSKLRLQSGFYSFSFIDKKNETIFAARDFFGKKPLYYYLDENLFILGSEDTAIRDTCAKYGIKLQIREESILHYFRYKDLHHGNTFFDGISEVPPGSSLNFDKNNWTLNIDQSWEDYYSGPPFYKVDSIIEQSKILENNKDLSDLPQAIENTIKKRFVSDVPIQVALSGGIDSTLVTIIAKENLNPDNINRAITVSSDTRPTEETKSKQLCTALDLTQEILNFSEINLLSELKLAIKAQGGPISHPHSIAYYLICRAAKLKGKVLVTGEGADELFYGYEHYGSESKKSSFAFYEHLKLEEYFEQPTTAENNYSEGFGKILRFNNHDNDDRDMDVKTHLLSLLRRNDRISMINSIELRSAFLDPDLFILINKFQQLGILNIGKFLLLDRIKLSYPNYSKDANKIGFYVPFDSWFESMNQENEIRRYVEIAIDYFISNFDLRLKKKIIIEGKLAWILLNIGIFLDLVDNEEL